MRAPRRDRRTGVRPPKAYDGYDSCCAGFEPATSDQQSVLFLAELTQLLRLVADTSLRHNPCAERTRPTAEAGHGGAAGPGDSGLVVGGQATPRTSRSAAWVAAQLPGFTCARKPWLTTRPTSSWTYALLRWVTTGLASMWTVSSPGTTGWSRSPRSTESQTSRMSRWRSDVIRGDVSRA